LLGKRSAAVHWKMWRSPLNPLNPLNPLSCRFAVDGDRTMLAAFFFFILFRGDSDLAMESMPRFACQKFGAYFQSFPA